MARLKVGVLVSGRGSNLQALLDSAADPAFPAEIALVLSNVPGAFALERATKAGVATAMVDNKAYDGRAPFEEAVHETLTAHGVEFVCLAGFMRLLTDGFVNRWHDRLINIHPSLLPSFKGAHAHRDALAAGVRLSGCTVHYVRPAMDSGPILVQAAVPVLGNDDESALGARVLEQEHRIYPLALRLIAEGRARVENEQVIIEGPGATGALVNPAP
ncbi:phosphoribosylglycinamide formyltransferase [Magnetospira sp. QH-2]|uniref:phosphoribosylglycinamide formyltransferase n=1 Tax=Magnetospira sp. (strain QH-2) TaxID=1288970 RepID=UPI0003E81A1B|nr:phosphoribosylglycinamide formyltransferase [Magnetospira sp. QH-2]CCQ72845.1 phosphoribosylglycinamide formyltransferase (GART) (GAR transformylase) (5'-phosphoribosylglycinamide transformylase) [Magnetospira sp. QH-2]